MLTQSVALVRVRAFAEAICQQQISLRKVVLFGSYARNEQRQFSDIDVALVADEFTGFGFQDVGLLGDTVIRKEFVDIEPHTFSPEQFTDWNLSCRKSSAPASSSANGSTLLRKIKLATSSFIPTVKMKRG